MQNLYVCEKVEFITLPNFKAFKCSKCDALVGMTEAGYKRFLKIKGIKPICHQCFWRYKGKVNIKAMNEEQMNELKKYMPELTKEKMEDVLKKIEAIKNAT